MADLSLDPETATFQPGLAARQVTASVWPYSILRMRSWRAFLWYSYTATTVLVPAVSTTFALGHTQVSTSPMR